MVSVGPSPLVSGEVGGVLAADTAASEDILLLIIVQFPILITCYVKTNSHREHEKR